MTAACAGRALEVHAAAAPLLQDAAAEREEEVGGRGRSRMGNAAGALAREALLALGEDCEDDREGCGCCGYEREQMRLACDCWSVKGGGQPGKWHAALQLKGGHV